MSEKNYALLRPLDLEAAKRGEPICWYGDGDVLHDVTITKLGAVCGRWYASTEERIWQGEELNYFRMAPLCWIEGKPVYKGDRLYRVGHGIREFVADYIEQDGDVFLVYVEAMGSSWLEGPARPGVKVTWTPPKIKREGFVCITKYSNRKETFLGEYNNTIVRNGSIFVTYEAAQKWADTCKDVVAIIPMSWEEPVQQE